MAERDQVAARRGGRPGPQIPLVQLRDPSYESSSHLPLVSDDERKSLAKVVSREQEDSWRESLLTSKDKKDARRAATAVVAIAGCSLVVSALDLVLHFLR